MAPASKPRRKPEPPWRHLAKLTFSTPAAIALLGEVEKLKPFGTHLERIVLGYERVSRAVWQAVNGLLPFTIPASHGALTLLVLLGTGVLIERRIGSAGTVPAEFGDKDQFAGLYVLAAAVLGIALLADTFFRSLVIASGLVSLFFVVLIPIIVVPNLRKGGSIRGELGWILLFPLSLYAVWAAGETFFEIGRDGLVALGDLAIAVACIALVIRYRPLSVIYVVCWAGGIFLVDFLASDVLPLLEGWLDGIGV